MKTCPLVTKINFNRKRGVKGITPEKCSLFFDNLKKPEYARNSDQIGV
ncbi:MAG: hypothetical protein ACFFB0_21480 [Promethearchaeota archaeon]